MSQAEVRILGLNYKVEALHKIIKEYEKNTGNTGQHEKKILQIIAIDEGKEFHINKIDQGCLGERRQTIHASCCLSLTCIFLVF